jgi:hypothetical protein
VRSIGDELKDVVGGRFVVVAAGRCGAADADPVGDAGGAVAPLGWLNPAEFNSDSISSGLRRSSSDMTHLPWQTDDRLASCRHDPSWSLFR